MIESYIKLSGKYMAANKRRTIYTLIGIVLSVALITSIGLFLKGIERAEIESTISTSGAFQLALKNPTAEQFSRMTANPKVKKAGLVSTVEAVNINAKIGSFFYVANKEALDLMPYHIKNGKFPVASNEVAMEEWSIRYLGKNIKPGSNFKLNGKDYRLTGVLENSIVNQKENRAVILSCSKTMDLSNSILLLEYKRSGNLRKTLDGIEAQLPKDSYMENTMLLIWYGAGGSTSGLAGLYMVLAIIIGIVFIATIAMIYNAFQISVVERMKQFGLLRAVGATPNQIRRLVYKEASLLALIGIPIGLAMGIVAIYCIGFVFKLIGGDSVLRMQPGISFGVLALSGIVSIVAIYCSALIPAVYAGRISPLVAISSRAFIKKEKKKKTKVFLMGKIFGAEGTMAAKNIKRNTKRYRITVFSIVISIVLFITFKSFMDMAFTVSSDINESSSMHLTIDRTSLGSEGNYSIPDEIVKKVGEMPEVGKMYTRYSLVNFKSSIDENQTVAEVSAIGGVYGKNTNTGDGTLGINCSLQGYDPESMKLVNSYLTAGKMDSLSMNEENGVFLIEKNIIRNEKTDKDFFGKMTKLKVGDYLEVGDSSKKIRLKIVGTIKAAPLNYYGSENGLKLLTTQAIAAKLIQTQGKDIVKAEAANRAIGLMIKLKDTKQDEIAVEKIDGIISSYPQLRVSNEIDQNKQEKTGTLMVKILLYGFVIVISMIGSVNIFNTHTTNIILRRRELATLKAIGMGQKKLRKMIILEGMIYGVAGTFYGAVIGSGLAFLLFRGINDAREMAFQIPYQAIAIAGIAALGVSYLSVLPPLARINKDNLIETIRDDY